MKKLLFISISISIAILSGCTGGLTQKTNNFFVINDSSSSMKETYISSSTSSTLLSIKLEVEKELLRRMNQAIPNIPLTFGLRSFGFGECMGIDRTKLNQSVKTYSKLYFNKAINSLLCGSGGSAMALAIKKSKSDLASNSGNTALIIFSDGHGLNRSPIPPAKALKKRYGEKLCIYTVWVGNPAEIKGRDTLLNLSNIGSCGFSITAADITSEEGMENFVNRVFF